MKNLSIKVRAVLCMLVLLQIHISSISQPATADNTFNPDFGIGSIEYITPVQFSDAVISHALRQPDGKIIIAYYYNGANGSLKRINTDGTIDQTFSAPVIGSLRRIARQSDGKIIVVGSFPKGILRLNADGSLDNSFNVGTGISGSGGQFIASVISVAIQSDNKILIGGFFDGFNGSSRIRIARLMSDGSLDVTFNPGDGPDNGVFDIKIQPDNKIVIGGGFMNYAGASRKTLARIHADGTLDESLTLSGTDGIVEAIALQSDGKIVAGGAFLMFNGVARSRIIRLNSDGTTDAGFIPGSGANSSVYSLAIDADGKILVGGDFSTFAGTTVGGLVRLNSTGAIDNTFKPYVGPDAATSTSRKVETILVEADGRIIVAGGFKNVNNTERIGIARLNADGSLEGGRGADNVIYAAANDANGKIVIGGTFTGYNGKARNRVARTNADGTLDVSFDAGPGANSAVHAIDFQSDGKIIVAGDFTNFGGTARNRIARINDTGTFDATFNPGSGANGIIYSIAVQADGKILIGGNFTQVDGITRNRIARLDLNGSVDANFDPGAGMDASVRTIKILENNKIVVGGDFNTVNGAALPKVAILNDNGSVDGTFVSTGCDGAVTALARQADGKIVIAGIFSTYNGVSKNRIARINSNGTVDETFDAGTAIGDYVRTISIQNNGKILAAGEFTKKVIRLNSNGTVDEDFFVEVGANEKVFASVIQTDGKIVLAGQFTSINGLVRHRIARLNGGDRQVQSITFNALPNKKFGDAPFDLSASTTSGLPLTFKSSNLQVATISNTQVTIVGAGTTEITVAQNGSVIYQPSSAMQVLTVSKADQVITFGELQTVSVEQGQITLSATSSSGLPVSFESSNANVGTISGDVLTINGIGTTNVTALQTGNANYNPAPAVVRVLEVGVLTSVEGERQQSLFAYPNPATDFVRVKVDDASTLSLRNALGNLVDKRVVNQTSGEVLLDVSHLPQGAYHLAITKQNTRSSQVIVKK